jgi:hypothetical protein
MKKTIRLTESELKNIIHKTINEVAGISFLPSDHPENEKINNLDDLERTLTEFVLSQICNIEDENDANQTYDNVANGLHTFFWQLNMNGYTLVKN